MESEDRDVPAKIKRLKERLSSSLKARFLVRFHVSLILGGAIAVGWVTDYLLLKVGLGSMVARYPCAVLAAYLGFVAGARLWIEYSGIREYINARRASELLDGMGDEKLPLVASQRRRESSWWDAIDVIQWFPGDEGCLVVIGVVLAIVVVVFLLYAAGGYLLMDAGGFFAEIVFELLLAAGLVRGMRKIDSPSWTGSLFSVTWPALAICLALAFAIGSWVQARFPEARTLPEAFDKWKFESSAPRKAAY